MGELPPRARRIPLQDQRRILKAGTTSACAENTLSRVADIFGMRNYLRVRGEYLSRFVSHRILRELPPRARRILIPNSFGIVSIGTTSACAENTYPYLSTPMFSRNYLRVRGEYKARNTSGMNNGELPPRARRIQFTAEEFFGHPGTTSACAENTTTMLTCHTRSWNYLRVRGEYYPNLWNPRYG